MTSLAELTSTDDPAIRLIREWASSANIPCEILPPSIARDDVLLAVQVSTHSILGAVAYETGGILLDGGWLRILGSGHPKLTRTLPDWNKGRAKQFYLVADDAVGGFFAMNGGSLGADIGKMYYFAPDCLRWEAMDIEYSQFVIWSMSEKLHGFYETLRWSSWRDDVRKLNGDRCFFMFPPLWTKEGSPERSHRGDVPVAESWGVQMDFVVQLEIDPERDGVMS